VTVPDTGRFSVAAETALRRAGWEPGRRATGGLNRCIGRLDSPNGFRIFPAAQTALEEFGGMAFDQRGPGISHGLHPFNLDPLVALGEEELFREFSATLGLPLYPLGDDGMGNFLAMDERGRVHVLTHELLVVGERMEDALERLTRGIAVLGPATDPNLPLSCQNLDCFEYMVPKPGRGPRCTQCGKALSR
jgi:hypothetical protein